MKQFLFTIALLSGFAVSAQSYTEGTDLPGTGTGPAFVMMGATMTISGTLTTPSDGQDRFQITIPSGCQITGVEWRISDTANLTVNGFTQFGTSNQETIPPLMGTFANGPSGPFPTAAGTYDCMMVANIAFHDVWSMTFYSDCPLGLANVNFAEQVSVYPNPTSDFLFVSGVAGESRFVLTNSLGQAVLSQKLSRSAMQPIDLTGLAEGVYYYEIVGEDSRTNGRISLAR